MLPNSTLIRIKPKRSFKAVSVYTSVKTLSRLAVLFGLLLVVLSLSFAHAETLYFDGENNSVGQWQHYVGVKSPNLLVNVFDDDALSRVIQIQGSGLNQGSLLGGVSSDAGWNNRAEFKLTWRMLFNSPYLIEIPVETLAGNRYLVYQANPPSTVLSGSFLYLSLGADSQHGQWTTQARDLSRDVEISEPGNRLLAVHGMIVRGSGRLDDIGLSLTGVASSRAKVQVSSSALPLASPVSIAAVKDEYGAYSNPELMVLATDGDRFASLELSVRHSTGSGGAPKSQSAALRQYDLAARMAIFSNGVSSPLPINRYGAPVIRADRTGNSLGNVVGPSANIVLSAVQGDVPLNLTATANNSTTNNGSKLLAWSDTATGLSSPSRFLGSTQSLDLSYPTVGEYVVRLLVMDERGNISSVSQSVSVNVPIVVTPPDFVVSQQDVSGLLNVLSWVAATSSESFDIRLLSSTGAVLDSVTDILVGTNCSGPVCSLTLSAGWVIDNGASLQIRSHNGSAVSVWVTSEIAPLANAGPDRGQAVGDSITVYGDNSTDRDGTIVSYHWLESGILLGQGASLVVQLPLGSHAIDLTVTDNSGHVSSDQMLVNVFAQSSISIGSNVGDVEKILNAQVVSKSQLNSHLTPIATANGYVYIANIEHGPNGDEDGEENGVTLRTVVRKGSQNANGLWSWESVLVEGRTVYDQWHTAPSIEVDRDGQVHVVYNMHNIPWQYKRTANPHDIHSFEFHGQYVSQQQINNWKFNNSTSFPSFGYADIPGTQITYPRFEKDPGGELYLTYRFASRPKRSWPERTFGAGLAEYSRADQTWTAIGEPMDVTSADFDFHPDAPVTSSPFAAKTGWTAYHPSLVFDNQYGMGVFMLWRGGTAGASTSKPCFVWSDNKLDFETLEAVPLSLPLQPEDCSNLGFADSQSFYNIADSEMDSQGNIYITLDPLDASPMLLTYKASTGQWLQEALPSNAAELFVDSDDNLWAVASGPTVHKRTAIESSWQEIYTESGARQCYPRATVSSDGSTAFIHTHTCSTWQDVSVFGIRLKP
jgi:hypothetical protein